MLTVHSLLITVWFLLLGFILALYVVLDGFTIGVGMLSLFSPTEERRSVLIETLGGVWDANETWLILLGGALFGAFPKAYGLLLHALYVPLSLLLFGLILRAVSFEFREHASDKTGWNRVFSGASALIALSQGIMLGDIIHGLPLHDGHYAGGTWGWLHPFSLVVAVGVLAGYGLLGATYLVLRTEDPIQSRARSASYWLAAVTFIVALFVTVWTPLQYPRIAHVWFRDGRFWFFAPLPLVAALAFLVLIRALRHRREVLPFVATVVIFLASFGGLAASLYPDIVPPSLSLEQAASGSLTLVFMLTGIGLLLPIMLVYNGYQYLVFRGKVKIKIGEGAYGHE
jgi:cytochrome d ubiquinol oxidase subunit II